MTFALFVCFVFPGSVRRVQAAHSVMWEQSFMAAQHSPILEPATLKVMEPLYNADVAITNLMIVLVSRGCASMRRVELRFRALFVAARGVCSRGWLWVRPGHRVGVLLLSCCVNSWDD